MLQETFLLGCLAVAPAHISMYVISRHLPACRQSERKLTREHAFAGERAGNTSASNATSASIAKSLIFFAFETQILSRAYCARAIPKSFAIEISVSSHSALVSCVDPPAQVHGVRLHSSHPTAGPDPRCRCACTKRCACATTSHAVAHGSCPNSAAVCTGR
jgi:hypothetical protein